MLVSVADDKLFDPLIDLVNLALRWIKNYISHIKASNRTFV